MDDDRVPISLVLPRRQLDRFDDLAEYLGQTRSAVAREVFRAAVDSFRATDPDFREWLAEVGDTDLEGEEDVAEDEAEETDSDDADETDPNESSQEAGL